MSDQDIYFFTTNNHTKSNFVERVQRTMKEKVYRSMRHNRMYRYVDDLQNVVVSYNATPHPGLKGLPSNDVNKTTKLMCGRECI